MSETSEKDKKNYSRESIALIEFDKILAIISEFCISDLGRARLLSDCYSQDSSFIEKNYQRLSEFRRIYDSEPNFPIHSVYDFSEMIPKLNIENYFMDIEAIHQLRMMSSNVREIRDYFHNITSKDDYTYLIDYTRTVFYDNALEREISKILTEDMLIRDDASPSLRVIRQRKSTLDASIQKTFVGTLQRYRNLGYLYEVGESIRQGRRVLSVLAEHKRAVKGIILDQSESGKVSYIEPSETIYLNNEAFEIEREEMNEIRKILIQLTHFISKYPKLIMHYQDFMTSWDVIRSKTKFSVLINGSIPKISKHIALNNAYHPLLKIKNIGLNRPTIPFHLDMEAYKMLMISGPNAGGKSITLKTIGLIAVMIQSSIPIPAEAGSAFPLFHTILADIGDLQSFEDELSTYSSKLKLWKEMIRSSDERTLLLLDELGDGTDPSFGAGMAQAVVESCLSRKSTLVATTHYSDLKQMAANREDILSGSMLFDEVKLEPIYKLTLGKPGSSYTFHIARKSGLSHQVIERAEKISNKEQVQFDKQLLRLEKKEKELHLRMQELDRKDRELKKQIKDWNRLHLDLDVTRKKIKYEKMLHNQEADILKAKEIREYKDALRLKQLEDLAEEQRIIDEKIKQEQEASKKLYREIHHIHTDHHFKVGDTVQYIETQTRGIIEKIQKNKAIVIFDNIKSTLSLTDLIPIAAEEKKKQTAQKLISLGQVQLRELDVRGKYVYEALPELEDFINKALLHNFHEIKIIHGKGKLKSEIHKSLQTYRAISKISHGLPEHGGDGVTYVYF